MADLPEKSGMYDRAFYDRFTRSSMDSANAVLAVLYAACKPESVVDVGCGRGGWLCAAKALGSSSLHGYDGAWVNEQGSLIDSDIHFTVADLSQSLNIEKRYDLCISLEVAEHLPPERALSFVSDLCSSSDVVLFSGAIEGQSSVGHVNEHRQSYWAELFKREGYESFDVIRPIVWNDRSVDWWYRQNVILYIKDGCSTVNVDILEKRAAPPLDLVHPDHFEEMMNFYEQKIGRPSLRFCLGCLKRYLRSLLHR